MTSLTQPLDRFQEGMAKSARQAIDHPLDLDQPIRWSCNCSGSCCRGTPVLIYPLDVWNLVHAPPEARERFGIQTSHDLFRERRGGSYFDLYLGKNSQMPVSSIRHRDGADEACPFLVPAPPRKSYTKRGRIALTVDGQPKVLCGVHKGRPGICRSYPFGRVITYAKEGATAEGITRHVDHREQCRSCYPGFDGEGAETEPGTIREFLERNGILENYRITDRWMAILDKMRRGIEAPQLRLLLGALAFDFDMPAMKALGATPEALLSPEQLAAVAAKRPPGFEGVLDRVEGLVDAVPRKDLGAVLGALGHEGPAPAAAPAADGGPHG